MPYLIKVEWSGYRTQAVIDVLKADDGKLTEELELWLDPENMSETNTIKLDWSVAELSLVLRLLTLWLSVSDMLLVETREHGNYEDVAAQQMQVHAALRDILAYVKALKNFVPGMDVILQERMQL